MISTNIIEQLGKTDWSLYGGQDHFNSNNVETAFKRMIYLDEESLLEEVQNDFLFAIGNNHRGTYYPVTLQAIEFIIFIALDSESEISRYAALEILILVYCTFSAENDNYKILTRKEIENIVDKKIESFKNRFKERLADKSESERNKETLLELLESIKEKNDENAYKK